MIELSIDNETMDVVPSAVVITIGAVLFEGDRVLSKHHIALPLQEQINAGRTISASTFMWWMGQDEKAKAGLLMAHRVEMKEARWLMRDLGAKARQIWARPGMFDLPMLRSLLGQDLWDDEHAERVNSGYQKERDLGTFAKEFDPLGICRPEFEGVPHNAMDDALHHHKWLMKLRRSFNPTMVPNSAYDVDKLTGASSIG